MQGRSTLRTQAKHNYIHSNFNAPINEAKQSHKKILR